MSDTVSPPPLVLTFAPSDPTGGGGLQADLLTCAGLGCQAVTTLTGYTVQDSANREELEDLSAEWIDDQARSLLEDMPIRAIKIGGLFTPEAVSAVAGILADYSGIPAVLHLGADALDSADAESEDNALAVTDALFELVLPQCTMVVCDQLRLDSYVSDGLLIPERGQAPAQALLTLGATAVLTTGVLLPSPTVRNVLYTAQEGLEPLEFPYEWKRIDGNYRGGGHTLSTAIAAMLAGGLPLQEAALQAQDFTWQSLAAAYRQGMGRRIPDRLFWVRQLADSALPASDTP
ncbi:MAG: hydroxymethylpyrimidine/phosphomethylpyrimidine kinase [Pigmentiphaga sp.]